MKFIALDNLEIIAKFCDFYYSEQWDSRYEPYRKVKVCSIETILEAYSYN